MLLNNYCFEFVGDTSSFGVAIMGEKTSNNGNHLLNKTSRMGHE
jgi:hypothetical protein